VCNLLVYQNLYVWTICSYYEFASERKFIRHCIKAEIKSTPLILQTAKESRKGNPQRNVTLSEIDTLLSFKILFWQQLPHCKLICCFNFILVISIKSSLLILQTAKESRKAFTYRLCDLLDYLNLYVWGICSYYEFAREHKFIRHCLK